MAELMSTGETTLSGEEVTVRSIPFFTNVKWRCQSQSARAATFVGRPPIPWGLMLLTIIAFIPFVLPGVIMYIFVVRRMIRFQNIVVTSNPISGGTDVVITHPKTVKKLVARYLATLPPISEPDLMTQVPTQGKNEPELIPLPEAKKETTEIKMPVQPLTKEEPKEGLFCPSCKITYVSGKFCKKCGSGLVLESVIDEKEEPKIFHPAERKTESFESQQKEETIKVLPIEIQAISSKVQKIEGQIEFIRGETLDKITRLEKEYKAIQKNVEEIRSIINSGVIKKVDIAPERKAIEKDEEVQKKADAARKQPTILIATDKTKESRTSPPIRKNLLLFPSPFFVVGGFIIIIAVAGFLLWPTYSYLFKKRPAIATGQVSKGDQASVSPSTPLPQTRQPSQPSDEEVQETGNIKSVLENIRQANLQKNIDLFMSCYSSDFKDTEGRKTATLETWKNFDYLDLSYNLTDLSVSGSIAKARVEWSVRISSKSGGENEEKKTTLDAIFQKEGGDWKIKEIKSVS